MWIASRYSSVPPFEQGSLSTSWQRQYPRGGDEAHRCICGLPAALPRSARRVRQAGHCRVKLGTRSDVQLRKDPAKVVSDSPVRDVELLADLTVRQSFTRQAGDLELLGRQL